MNGSLVSPYPGARSARLPSVGRLRSSLVTVLVSIGALAFPSVPGGMQGGERDLEAELAQAQAARVLDPEDPVALGKLADISARKGDTDSQMAYLVLLLGVLDELEVDDERQKEKDVKLVTDALAKLDPSSSALKTSRDRYVGELDWALDLYTKNKKVRNALDVAGRILRYRPDHKRASRVAGDVPSDANDAFRAEALRLLGQRELSRPRTFLTDWARAHEKWEDAGVLETDGYVVRTNIGYDTLRFSTQVLENLAVYYRRFYDADPKLLRAKTNVLLYRTRDEFLHLADERMDKSSPGLAGFLAPTLWMKTLNGMPQGLDSMSFALYSYDPRNDGGPLSALTEVLSHEASHQYMCLSTGQTLAPLWLNEGMACFFEGAVIRADGEVQVGLPARQRMLVLPEILDKEPDALSQVLSAQGRLPGLLYPVAWGLVYYLYQHQVADGYHPYRRDLKEALRLVRAGNSDGPALFQAAVLAPHGLTMEKFRTDWIAAMRALRELELTPDVAAAQHLEKARAFLAAGATEAAREGFERVLIYWPQSAPALLGIAEIERKVSAKTKALPDKDVTLLWARRAHRAATLASDAEVVQRAAEIAKEADPGGFERIARSEASYRKDVQRQIARHLGEGRSKTALVLADHWQDRVLGDESASELLRKLRAESAFELQRAFAPFDGRSLIGLACSPKHFRVENSELFCRVERPDRGALSIEHSISPRFRLEGELFLGDANCTASLCVELPWLHLLQGFTLRPLLPKGQQPLQLLYPPFDLVEYGHVAQLGQGQNQQDFYDLVLENPKLAKLELLPGTWVPFVLERNALDALDLHLAGKKVASRPLDPREAEVRVSLTFFGGEGRLRNLRIIEKDRL